MTMKTSGNCCSSCLLPPRQSKENSKLIPLLRCSRCREVWYHDVDCQRKHYKVHRQVCHPSPLLPNAASKAEIVSSTPNNEGRAKQQQFTIEYRPGKGRCMIALQSIRNAQTIQPSSSNTSVGPYYFQPLVPPVLAQNRRLSHCALCFGTLKKKLWFQQNPHNLKYPVLLCSHECLHVGKAWLAEEERLMATILNQEPDDDTSIASASIHTVLSTAIFVYRICLGMVKDPTIKATVESLQTSQDNDLLSMAEDARAHALAAILTVKKLLGATEAEHLKKSLLNIDGEVIWEIISKLKVNAFTICDGEFAALGLGVFPIASNINHSCQPNALQTYRYGVHEVPRLRLTTCTSIRPREEICISYIDSQVPRHLRHKKLIPYGFECTCSHCMDEERETRLVGLKCQRCNGIGRLDSITQTWRCESCQSFLPEEAWKVTKAFSEIDRAVSQGELKHYYETFCAHCFRSSWYYLNCASAIVDDRLGYMERCKEISEKMSSANTALEFLDAVLETPNDEEWTVLHTNMLRFKAAKLRLFLGSDIARGMQEMNVVHKTLLVYYPPDHEIFEEVRNTIGLSP